ncbi:uncharacterized protein LOC128679215 [Plodia interpunctella]|uniref:uncharacterized protein LOC128679215 n=1 Tax=Plodia interpunctella TaxID=58824 RepID=UPI0023675092|nr:uncharacterized protein LOC128679215 [Plodia interpunctella]XP_053617271.1 uncharacterized protein LOC128679215 [Plodia interpunctella]
MPPSKDSACNKSQYSRSFSSGNSGMSMSARVYHPATNLMPLTPPHSPTGIAPSFSTSRSNGTTPAWGRQNSTNGKYS